MARDLVTHPYAADEQRVVDWLVARARGMVGDDPIGFILASYEQVWQERDMARDALTVARGVCGQNNCNCKGALPVKQAIERALR
jgi:hypothetical protein